LSRPSSCSSSSASLSRRSIPCSATVVLMHASPKTDTVGPSGRCRLSHFEHPRNAARPAFSTQGYRSQASGERDRHRAGTRLCIRARCLCTRARCSIVHNARRSSDACCGSQSFPVTEPASVRAVLPSHCRGARRQAHIGP
jgi:hypothetical protein